jgi:uncharacterized membrane protein
MPYIYTYTHTHDISAGCRARLGHIEYAGWAISPYIYIYIYVCVYLMVSDYQQSVGMLPRPMEEGRHIRTVSTGSIVHSI